MRQDSFTVGTFVKQGIFLGAIPLRDGQVTYGGATGNQDEISDAILGRTDAYAGVTDRGTR